MSIAFAFVVGIITFIDPCVIATLPGILGFLTGRSEMENSDVATPVKRPVLIRRILAFIAGFSTFFFIVGGLVIIIGPAFARVVPWFTRISAVLLILIGLGLLGALTSTLVRLTAPVQVQLDKLLSGTQSKYGAYTLGLMVSVPWIPCSGPIMAAIVFLASAQLQIPTGIALLIAFCVGLGLPFLLAELGAGTLVRRMKAFRPVLAAATALAGVVLIVIGILLLTDNYRPIAMQVKAFYENNVPMLYGWRENTEYGMWYKHWFGTKS